MARNAEKAMTALARWRRMKLEEERGPIERRPNRVTDCTDLRQAERWRREIIKEIAKKITQIQNQIAKAVSSWQEKKESGTLEKDRETERKTGLEDDDPDIYEVEEGESDEEGPSTLKRVEFDEQGQPKYIAHVPVPTQKDVEEALLRRKKIELLEKYASDALIEQCETAKTLLGFQSTGSTDVNSEKST